MKNKRRFIHLNIPTIRKYRNAVGNGDFTIFLANICEKKGVRSAGVKFKLDNRPYRVSFKVEKLCR